MRSWSTWTTAWAAIYYRASRKSTFTLLCDDILLLCSLSHSHLVAKFYIISHDPPNVDDEVNTRKGINHGDNSYTIILIY